jgi:hypothetical protein
MNRHLNNEGKECKILLGGGTSGSERVNEDGKRRVEVLSILV